MRIMICGSMAFASQMHLIKEKLEQKGFAVSTPNELDQHIADIDLVDDLDRNFPIQDQVDVMKISFDLVAGADAVLFLNFKRNGVEGYIGTSGLMEMAIAYYLKKKIFILYPVPDYHEQRWAFEISLMHPIFLNGDLAKILES